MACKIKVRLVEESDLFDGVRFLLVRTGKAFVSVVPDGNGYKIFSEQKCLGRMYSREKAVDLARSIALKWEEKIK